MKLTDFYFFEPLNDLRTRMGIGQDVYGTLTVLIHPGRLTPSELEKLSSEEGLEIESLDDIKVLDDGTLALKDRRVLLYIRDISSYQGKPVQPPRFHLVNCDVLQKMRSRNRLYRYVVAVKPDGLFAINIMGSGPPKREVVNLSVCQNCLNFLALDGFRIGLPKPQRLQLVENFSIPAFFQRFPQSLHQFRPEFDDEHAPLNEYGTAFRDISLRVRQAAEWRCQNRSCRIDLSDGRSRRFLHTHHKNGLKWDNSEENLLVLCLECHSREPSHEHMRALPIFREFLKYKKEPGSR